MPLGPALWLSPWGHLSGIASLTSNSQCERVSSAKAPEGCCRFLAHRGLLCDLPEVGARRPAGVELQLQDGL